MFKRVVPTLTLLAGLAAAAPLSAKAEESLNGRLDFGPGDRLSAPSYAAGLAIGRGEAGGGYERVGFIVYSQRVTTAVDRGVAAIGRGSQGLTRFETPLGLPSRSGLPARQRHFSPSF